MICAVISLSAHFTPDFHKSVKFSLRLEYNKVNWTQFEQFDLVNCSCSKSSNQSFVLGFVHPFSGLGGRPPVFMYKFPNPRRG